MTAKRLTTVVTDHKVERIDVVMTSDSHLITVIMHIRVKVVDIAVAMMNCPVTVNTHHEAIVRHTTNQVVCITVIAVVVWSAKIGHVEILRTVATICIAKTAKALGHILVRTCVMIVMVDRGSVR